MLTPEDRTAIREQLDQITGFPWRWGGDTDDHTVALHGWKPGIGTVDVLSLVGVERDPDGLDAARLKEHLVESGSYEEEGLDEWLRDVWAIDTEGEPREDLRLAFANEELDLDLVEDVPVFYVAREAGLPDDTPRDDPHIYRSKIVDLRNVNARFIAAAPARIDAMLNLLDRQDYEIAALKAQIAALRETQPKPPVYEQVAWVSPQQRPGLHASDAAKDYAQMRSTPGTAEFTRLASQYDADPAAYHHA